MKNQQRGNKFGLGHHKFMFEKCCVCFGKRLVCYTRGAWAIELIRKNETHNFYWWCEIIMELYMWAFDLGLKGINTSK